MSFSYYQFIEVLKLLCCKPEKFISDTDLRNFFKYANNMIYNSTTNGAVHIFDITINIETSTKEELINYFNRHYYSIFDIFLNTGNLSKKYFRELLYYPLYKKGHLILNLNEVYMFKYIYKLYSLNKSEVQSQLDSIIQRYSLTKMCIRFNSINNQYLCNIKKLLIGFNEDHSLLLTNSQKNYFNTVSNFIDKYINQLSKSKPNTIYGTNVKTNDSDSDSNSDFD